MTIENNVDKLREKYASEQFEAADALMTELKSIGGKNCEWNFDEIQSVNGGLVVEKTKPSGEVVLYPVPGCKKKSS